MHNKSFPWRCHHCSKLEVQMATIKNYIAEVRIGDTVHAFPVMGLEIPICQACGEKVFTVPVDNQINTALKQYKEKL